MAANVLESCRILGDAAKSFSERCLKGLKPDFQKIDAYLKESLMLVTALNPHIGYDNASKMAKYAHYNNTTLKAAAEKLQDEDPIFKGVVENYDQWVDPLAMTGPKPSST